MRTESQLDPAATERGTIGQVVLRKDLRRFALCLFSQGAAPAPRTPLANRPTLRADRTGPAP